jgi:hypothetical protein
MLALFSSAAFPDSRPASSPPHRHSTEVKIISAPPAQPTEVKIISTPPATQAEVKIVSAPPDESARAMVRLTVWILIANAVLCLVTFVIGMRQSGDNKRSLAISRRAAGAATRSANAAKRSSSAANSGVQLAEKQRRETLLREANGSASKVASSATVVIELAKKALLDHRTTFALAARTPLQGEAEKATERQDAAKDICDEALKSTLADLANRSDEELGVILRRMDVLQSRLDGMKELINGELAAHALEITLQRQHIAAMQAGKVTGSGLP